MDFRKVFLDNGRKERVDHEQREDSEKHHKEDDSSKEVKTFFSLDIINQERNNI